MRSRRSWLALAALLCLGLMAGLGPAQAAPISFTAQLSGAQQVPPVATSATGSANLTYDSSTRVLTWSVSYSGIASEVTMAHFHGPAAAGSNAGVEIWISVKGSAATSPITGQATLTADQARQLMAGQLYINVHSKDHPSGEIRGQVVPPQM